MRFELAGRCGRYRGIKYSERGVTVEVGELCLGALIPTPF